MSFNRRLDVLQQKLAVEVVDGWCSKCRNRCLTLYYDQVLPAPCAVCGMVARSVVYICNPTGPCAAPIELATKCKTILVLPDNGRDERR